MISIIVDNRLRFPPDTISEPIKQQLRNLFTHKNQKHSKLRAMGYWAGNEPEYIRTFEDSEDGEFSLPRGGTMRVREVLKENGIAYRFVDCSFEGPLVGIPDHKLKLYPYQQEALEACIAKRNCLLQSPTGSGKTTIALGIIAKLKRRALVVVWNTGLAKQWIERLEYELGIPKKAIGQVMGGKVRLADVTVAMQQTLYSKDPKKLGIDKHFGVLIADECQKFSAKTYREVTEPFHCKWRIGISADYTRHDRQEGLTRDIFGGVAYEIDKSVLSDSNFIHDVEIRVIPTSFEAPWYEQERNFLHLTQEMGEDQDRSELTLKIIQECVSDGGSVLVFCHRISHCRRLESLVASAKIQTELMLGGLDGVERFNSAVKGLRNGTVKVGVGTIQAIGQGIDIPAVSRGIIASPISNNRQQFNQVIGRICRRAKGKEDAIVYYLWDKAVYGLSTLTNLKAWNRNVLVLDGEDWVDCNSFIQDHKRRARGLSPQHVLRS